jgi:hypothetical protein
MKYYKDENNQVYAYAADGSQDAYIKEGLIPISQEQALAITNPPETPEQVAERTSAQRKAAYETEADPLFFKAQRGEATMEDWLAKVEEIKQRYVID